MATSGSTDFSVNRNEIIYGALRALGMYEPGQTPDAYMVQDATESLNLMVKHWIATGIGLWKNTECALFLTDDQQSYSLYSSGDHCTSSWVKTEVATAGSTGDGTIVVDSATGISNGDNIGIEQDDGTIHWTTVNGVPVGTTITLAAVLTDDVAVDNHVYTYTSKIVKPFGLIEARLHRADGTDIPLWLVSYDEYMALSNKTSTGPANQLHYKQERTLAKVLVWPVCDDVQEYIKMTLRLPFEDFDASSDDPDFPVEWAEALKWNLAVRYAPECGRSRRFIIDSGILDMAGMTLQEASDYDVEYEPVQFVIESR